MKLQLLLLSRRTSIAVAATAAALVAASAGTASAATCPPPPTSVKPFVPWNDSADYVLTTGGSFEAGDPSWALSGGATVIADNAPNALDPRTHARALALPAGATATSACVTAPHIVGIVRFWVRSASPGAQLKVEILVKGGVYQAGTITAGTAWNPSPMLHSNAPDYKGAVTYQVRMTAIGGTFTVDDVYFDPFSSK